MLKSIAVPAVTPIIILSFILNLIIALGLSIPCVRAITITPLPYPLPNAYCHIEAYSNVTGWMNYYATATTGPVRIDMPPINPDGSSLSESASAWATPSYHQFPSPSFGEVYVSGTVVEGTRPYPYSNDAITVLGEAQFSIAVIQNLIPPFMPPTVPIGITATGSIAEYSVDPYQTPSHPHAFMEDNIWAGVASSAGVPGGTLIDVNPIEFYGNSSASLPFGGSLTLDMPVTPANATEAIAATLYMGVSFEIVSLYGPDPGLIYQNTVQCDPSISFDQAAFDAEYGTASFPLADYFGLATSPYIITTAVPEPATMLLLGSGFLGLWGFRRKFKK